MLQGSDANLQMFFCYSLNIKWRQYHCENVVYRYYEQQLCVSAKFDNDSVVIFMFKM